MKFSLLSVVGMAVMMAAGSAQAQTPPPGEGQGGAAAGAQPEAPAGPKPIPVPEGPVVKKTELEGGLVAEDLVIGDGAEIKPGGAVVVLYHGTRKSDGKVFDSAFERGEPIAFPLGNVIPGWQKGVPGMKIGGVRKLTIPAAMAYGEHGAGADIPPNTDLVFVIKVLDAVTYTDEVVGTGEAAQGQCVPVTRHTIKDDGGKEVEKVDGDKLWVWIPGELQGVNAGVDGMKVGGKRKIHVPKEFNPAAPQMGTSRPQNVPLDVELELVAVRNLMPQRR